jgi:DNA repair exonuclease SbcCD ATPase subunit
MNARNGHTISFPVSMSSLMLPTPREKELEAQAIQDAHSIKMLEALKKGHAKLNEQKSDEIRSLLTQNVDLKESIKALENEVISLRDQKGEWNKERNRLKGELFSTQWDRDNWKALSATQNKIKRLEDRCKFLYEQTQTQAKADPLVFEDTSSITAVSWTGPQPTTVDITMNVGGMDVTTTVLSESLSLLQDVVTNELIKQANAQVKGYRDQLATKEAVLTETERTLCDRNREVRDLESRLRGHQKHIQELEYKIVGLKVTGAAVERDLYSKALEAKDQELHELQAKLLNIKDLVQNV